MSTHRNAAGDVITAYGPTAEWAEARGYEPLEQVTPATELRGQALDDALDAAGLPKTGKVADKQARLAEWQADPANSVTPDSVDVELEKSIDAPELIEDDEPGEPGDPQDPDQTV